MGRGGRVAGLAGFVLAVFVLTLLPGGIWAELLAVNLKTGIDVPWSVPLGLVLLWLAWRLAGGRVAMAPPRTIPSTASRQPG